MRSLFVPLLLAATVSMAVAQTGTPEGADSHLTPGQIAQRRTEVEASRAREASRFDAMDAECRTRFAVNDCLRSTQAQRRAAMADLRSQEVALNDMERKQRAADQIRRTEEKAAERRQKEQEVAAAQASQLAAREQRRKELADRRAAQATPPDPRTSPKTAKAPSGPTPEQQAANRAELESRRAEAARRKRDVERRQQEKAGKPASSLPVPP